jgi:LAO/AO transport system ATPase
VIGVSLHSAAHLTIMPEVIRWQQHYGIDDIPLVLGGIIPESDYGELQAMGVNAVFNPGSSIATIIRTIQELAAGRAVRTLDELTGEYADGRINALARLVTCLQRRGLNGFQPPAGHAKVIGITGAPGVGKSSFIGKLAIQLREQGQKVAVIAVDPTSPITGGALLGDRLRMMRQEPDEGFFVRSLASLSEHGGLGPNIASTIELIAGFGFDTILVETVGTGQTDTAVLDVTRHVLLLLMPESGDDVQFAKAGIMEIASGYVLNKSDLPGADTTHRNLLESLGSDRPVWQVSTLQNRGLEEVAKWVKGITND